jgi:hypothetical protein
MLNKSCATKGKAKDEKRKKEQYTCPKQGFVSRNDVSFLTPGSRNDSKKHTVLCS